MNTIREYISVIFERIDLLISGVLYTIAGLCCWYVAVTMLMWLWRQ